MVPPPDSPHYSCDHFLCAEEFLGPEILSLQKDVDQVCYPALSSKIKTLRKVIEVTGG